MFCSGQVESKGASSNLTPAKPTVHSLHMQVARGFQRRGPSGPRHLPTAGAVLSASLGDSQGLCPQPIPKPHFLSIQ